MTTPGSCSSFSKLETRARWLADYQMGSLDVDEERHFERHLRHCRACDAALGVFRHQLSEVEEAINDGAALKS